MASKELKIIRTFSAPVKTIWQAWTEPEHFKKWWGPKIFTCPVSKIDLKVGGKYLHCMRGPDGKEYWSTGTYKEIIPLKRIVCTDSFADEKGNIVPASDYGMTGFPLELEVTIEFEDLGDKTKMTLVHRGIENIDTKMREMMDQGWNESFDKIDQQLKTKKR